MNEVISHLSLVLALTGYSISSGMFLHAFPQPVKRQRTQKAAFRLFSLSTVMVATALSLSLIGEYYSQTSGLILITVISALTIFSHVKYKIKLIGIFVAPLATLVLIFLAFQYHTKVEHISDAPPDTLLTLHIVVAILGQSFAILAFAISSLYLFQQRALKKKQFNFITSATPPLNKLEKALMMSLWLGFSCLSLSLLTGAIYYGFFSPTPMVGKTWKITWAVSVWVWYLAILLAKNVFTQSGRTISRMSLIGFLLLFITFFGLTNWGALA